MTLAAALAVIDRWAHCRCVCVRAPTAPCRCELANGRWACERPVADDCDRVTARERAEWRKRKA